MCPGMCMGSKVTCFIRKGSERSSGSTLGMRRAFVNPSLTCCQASAITSTGTPSRWKKAP